MPRPAPRVRFARPSRPAVRGTVRLRPERPGVGIDVSRRMACFLMPSRARRSLH